MRFLIVDNFNDYSSISSRVEKGVDYISVLISSYIKSIKGNHADIINALVTTDFIFNVSYYSKYDMVIIHIDEDNICSVLRVIDTIKSIPIFFLSKNEDLSQYFSSSMINCYFNYDERESEIYNLRLIHQQLHLDGCINEAYKITCICKEKKSATINIGSGCCRKCSFCSISNSNVHYYPVEEIIEELKDSFNEGITYFHINNHSFTSDVEYVRKFCNYLIEKCSNYDFKWSCFIIPENILEDLEVLTLMKEAKLDRIEIGIENINQSILNNFNIDLNEIDIMHLIEFCDSLMFSSIVINYIVGDPDESEKTLTESKKFIEKLVEKTYGRIDVNVSFFYPDMDAKYVEYINFSKRISMLSKCVRRKESCVCSTNHLSLEDIYYWKWNLMKNLYLKRKSFISKLSPQQRINICLLHQYGIKTQYWELISTSSVVTIVNKIGIYDVHFFVKDILTKSQCYAPKLIFDKVEIDDVSGKVFIRPTPFFVEEQQIQSAIDISEFNLYEYMLAEKNLNEIISNNCSEVEDKIIKLLELLESVHLIYYIRILN
ncbi:MAG: radical SAM protein [Bacteroidales bacterium]|jgi:hypothetical protein|nr:radical SAM protein [Bacteroidales bacterium]